MPDLRGLVAALSTALLVTGCGQTVPASEVLAGESLAWDPVAGAQVVDEAVVDQSSGGLTGKPSVATVSRHLVPTEGATLDELVAQLVAESMEQGWESTAPTTRPYRATKSLAAGRGLLLISAHPERVPARVVLTMTGHN